MMCVHSRSPRIVRLTLSSDANKIRTYPPINGSTTANLAVDGEAMDNRRVADPIPSDIDVADDAVTDVIARFGGDYKAAIAALIADIEFLAFRLSQADSAVSRGFTRGWRPLQPAASQKRP